MNKGVFWGTVAIMACGVAVGRCTDQVWGVLNVFTWHACMLPFVSNTATCNF